MRRHDREITDAAQIDAVIRACDCCRLGFADGGNWNWRKGTAPPDLNWIRGTA